MRMKPKISCALAIAVLILAVSSFPGLATPAPVASPAAAQIYHLPLVFSPPGIATLYIVNQTGGTLCFEVLNSGIGQKCVTNGDKKLYGTFTAGTYDWKATANACSGTVSGKDTYIPGDNYTDTFVCRSSSPLNPAGLNTSP